MASTEKHEILKIIADNDKYKHKIKMVFVGHGHQFKEIKWKPDPNDDLEIPFYETTSTGCGFDKTFDPHDPERREAAETACKGC